MGKSEIISVQAELVLTLRNYEDWCSKCPSKLPGKRTPGESFLFVDTNGNTLFSGSDFMEATKRRSYPVKVYRTVNVCNSFYSHSPAEPDSIDKQLKGTRKTLDYKLIFSKTHKLQEGDWFTGTEEQYRKVFNIENNSFLGDLGEDWIKGCISDNNGIVFNRALLVGYPSTGTLKKTKLTPEEFLRRAENTFKTK